MICKYCWKQGKELKLDKHTLRSLGRFRILEDIWDTWVWLRSNSLALGKQCKLHQRSYSSVKEGTHISCFVMTKLTLLGKLLCWLLSIHILWFHYSNENLCRKWSSQAFVRQRKSEDKQCKYCWKQGKELKLDKHTLRSLGRFRILEDIWDTWVWLRSNSLALGKQCKLHQHFCSFSQEDRHIVCFPWTKQSHLHM